MNEITLSDGNDAGTGDLVRARLNVKIDAGGQELTNRDTLKITGWRGAGDKRAVAVRQTGRDSWSAPFTVPVAYLEENAELAYAGNVHVAEGRTVDTGHLLVSPTLTRESMYVGMTRGRERNTAHVVTGPATGREAQQAPAEAVLAAAMGREDAQLSATETIREAQAWTTNSQRLFEIFDELARQESYPAFEAALKARLGEAEYQRYLTDPQREVLLAELRGVEAAGHDVDEVLDQVTRQSFEGARSIAAVLHGRVSKLDLPSGRTTTWEERMPKAWREYAASQAQAERDDPEGPRPPAEGRTLAGVGTASDLTGRRLELGAAAAAKPPVWAVRYLGMPPREPGRLRDDWINRVGLVAAYREAAGHADPEQAVGPAPAGQPVLREAYRASVAALEMQEEERVRVLPQRDLEARIREYGRAVAWAPQQVGPELEATEQAEQDTLRQAEAAAWRRDMQEIASSARALAAQLAERRAALDEIAAARDDWEAHHAGPQERAREAVAELDRRGIQHEDPEPQAAAAEAEPASEPEQPQADPRAVEIDRHIAQAREAAARIAAEREQARQAEAEETDLEHSTSRAQPEAEAPQAQPWQPGQAPAQPEPERGPEAVRDEPEAEAELELEM